MTPIERAIGFGVGALLVVLALFGSGYLVGRAENQVHAAEQRLADAQSFNDQYSAEVQRGRKDSGAYQAELQALYTNFTTLEGQYRVYMANHPLVVYRPAAAGDRVGAVAGAGVAGPEGAAAGGAQAAPAGGGDGSARFGLTVGAVGLWNAALQGVGVSAAACRPDDPPGGACDADSGLTVNDAWWNQRTNAQSCAATRLQLNRLIDHLEGRPAPMTNPQEQGAADGR